jgi:cytidylate kinase
MYRCVALARLRGEADPAALDIALGDRVTLGGEDVTAAIRTPEASAAASRVATDPGVRAALVRKQQELLRDGDWVAEGRDIALVVAPGAEVKVFLTADPRERARRRAEETGQTLDEVLEEQQDRDARDATGDRTVDAPAPGATALDTTGLTIDAVVERIRDMAMAAR